MITSPYINALFASAYITFVANVMFYGSELEGLEPSVFVPIMVLSLLVFSAAMMGYLFFFQPLCLYIDGHKKEAVVFFLKTVGSFALLTMCIGIITLFSI